jgi:ribosomal protein S18 acetylase RimI-like enzyme
MIVRRAVATEVEAGVDVWRLANAASRLERHPERLQRWAQETGAKLYVAVDEEQVIGMILSLATREDDGAGALIPRARHITGLAVLPHRQRRGVGRALLRAAVDDARAEQCDRITLWTHVGNDSARRLFEAHGFRPTGRSGHDDAGEPTMQLLATIRGEQAQSGGGGI